MKKDLIAEFDALQKKLKELGTPAAVKAAIKCGSAMQILDEEWTDPKPKTESPEESKVETKPATKKATA